MSISAAPGIAKSSQALVFKKNTNSKSLAAAYNEGTSARPRTTLKTTVGGNVSKSTLVTTLSGGTFNVASGRSLRNVNPNLVKPDNSALRAGLNPNKGYDIAFMKDFASKFGKIANPYANNTNHLSTLDKIALLTAAGVQIGKAIDSASTKSTTKTPDTTQNNSTVDVSKKAMTSGASSTSLMGGLSGANSFNDINGLEAKAENIKNSFNNYKEGNKVDFNFSQDTANTLKTMDIDIDIDSLALSDLNMTDLEGASETIQKDYQKIGQFKSTDIQNAKTKLSSKKGQINGNIKANTDTIARNTASINNLKASISSLDEQINILSQKINIAGEGGEAQLEELIKQRDAQKAELSKLENENRELTNKNNELNAELGRVKTAETEISALESACDEAVEQLKTRESEIKDLQKFEDEVQSKKYDLAKKQDETLAKTMKEISNIDKEIKTLVAKNNKKTTDNDGKRNGKIDQLNSQKAALYQTLSSTISSLQDAGTTSFKYKNNTYEVKNLDKAQSYLES